MSKKRGPKPVRTKNPSEYRFAYETAPKRGYYCIKVGWPDFLCLRDGKPDSVCEVKPGIFKSEREGRERLKYEQTMVMAFLQANGIRCFVSDGANVEAFNMAEHGCKRYMQEWLD